jgi:hypothetical protein
MHRFVVVCPIEPLRVGQRLPVERWPLHVTVIPSFRTRSSFLDVKTAIGSFLSSALDVRVGGEEMFGASGSILVNVMVDDSGALDELHNRLLTTLEDQCGLTPDDPLHFRDGYRSHITATRQARAEPGALIHLNQLALVDMEPLGDAANPTVVSTINFAPIGD